jgi:DNA-binding Lrp family transcriptional regulator
VNERLEQEIIGLYNADIGGAYSINEIARRLNRAYPYIHKKVSELLAQGILTEVTIGKSHLCSVNLANDDAILLLSLNESSKKKEAFKKDLHLKTLIHNLEETNDKIATIIKTRAGIIIVAESDFTLKIPTAKVFSVQAFKESYLLDEDARKTHIVLYSFERYFQIMKDIQGKLRMANLFPKA